MSKVIIYTFMLTILMVGFQNCSGVNFEAAPTSDKVSNEDFSVGENDVDGDDDFSAGEDDNGKNNGNNGKKDDENIGENDSDKEICTEDNRQSLFAGQHHNVGDVLLAINGNILSVTIQLKDGVQMSESHVNVGSSIDSTKGSPGQFAYQSSHNNVSEYTYLIDLSKHNLSFDSLFIAVHAVVSPETGSEGDIISGQETSWAEGAKAGVGWAMVFQYAEVCE